MEIDQTLPFNNTYWVVPGKLIAGDYPGSYSIDVTTQRIRALLNSGVKTIIDLTRVGDSNQPYSAILLEQASLNGIKVDWINYPIFDMSAPKMTLMIKILNEIDQAISSGKLVYVHCLAGIGRTGTVVGCYLVRHGLGGDVALEQITHLRRNLPFWWHQSPEVPEQMEFILKWKIGL